MARLTQRLIKDSAHNAKGELRLWDDAPRGLGVRIKSTGSISFFVQYKSPVTGRKTRLTLGAYGAMTIDEAREAATDALREVRRGLDPAIERRRELVEARTKAQKFRDLCDDYMRDAREGLITYRGRPKKQRTLADDHGRIERHIKPLLGDRLVVEITSTDIMRFMRDVRLGKTRATVKSENARGVARVTGGPATAARTVDLLGSIFSYAMRQGLIKENPIKGVERPPSRKRDRVLSPQEYARLGQALDELEGAGHNSACIAALRVLALTGCRRTEILSLRRDAVDEHHQVLRLADTKSGQQVRAIGGVPMRIICASTTREGNVHVFPSAKGNGPIVGVRLMKKAFERAGLPDVSIHTLRHSFASTALELEYSELTIAGLLGHRSHSVTSRYAHHVDRALVAAADRIANTIAGRMGIDDQGAHAGLHESTEDHETTR